MSGPISGPSDAAALRVSLLGADGSVDSSLIIAPSADGGGTVIDGAITAHLLGFAHGRALIEGSDTRDLARAVALIGPPTTGSVRGRIVREVVVDGWRFEVAIESDRVASLRDRASRGEATAATAGPLDVRAIIPGRIVALSVVPGDAVTTGQQLMVLEAMKMQNELRAPREGTIARVAVALGDRVEVGDVLLVLE
ncbi:MAG TPA: biotin/lipoyl-containing protein [Candidatus Acidoferrum sp.]|nr:biotin/lipoyl-containing protein [Candidatus Acidoferrum sp.]